MIESLELIDKNILVSINSFHNSFFDTVMFYVSGNFVFLPFFLYIIYLIYAKVGIKKTSILILSLALLITLCDQTSNITKKTVKRYRPSHNIEIEDSLNIVNNYKGGQYGFFSSHATNTFGVATFMFLLFSSQTLAFRLLFFLWAILISYSRMYLGVHYPSDIFVGMIVGVVFGFYIFKLQRIFILKKYNEIISI